MLSKNPFTLNIMNDILNKPLYFLEDGRLNVSNIIDYWALSKIVMINCTLIL